MSRSICSRWNHATVSRRGTSLSRVATFGAVLIFGTAIGMSAVVADEALGSEDLAVREAVRAVLNDPDSAIFGEFALATPTAGCLAVKAKNASGEYIGPKQVALYRDQQRWMVLKIFPHNTQAKPGAEQAFCLDIMRSTAEKMKARTPTPSTPASPPSGNPSGT